MSDKYEYKRPAGIKYVVPGNRWKDMLPDSPVSPSLRKIEIYVAYDRVDIHCVLNAKGKAVLALIYLLICLVAILEGQLRAAHRKVTGLLNDKKYGEFRTETIHRTDCDPRMDRSLSRIKRVLESEGYKFTGL